MFLLTWAKPTDWKMKRAMEQKMDGLKDILMFFFVKIAQFITPQLSHEKVLSGKNLFQIQRYLREGTGFR